MIALLRGARGWLVAGAATAGAVALVVRKLRSRSPLSTVDKKRSASSKEVFATSPDDARVAPTGWVAWRGKLMTAEPLVSTDDKLYARLRYSDALDVAKREGARLLTEAEWDSLAEDAEHGLEGVQSISPCFLPTEAMRAKVKREEGESDIAYEGRLRVDQASREWAEIHDFCVHEKLAALKPDWTRPIINIGKTWLPGGFNYGWFVNGRPAQPRSGGHINPDGSNTWIDYSQLTYLIKDKE